MRPPWRASLLEAIDDQLDGGTPGGGLIGGGELLQDHALVQVLVS